MKKILMLCATLSLLLSACGIEDSPTMDVTEEAAGAKCPHGGVKIIVDYTIYYACNGAQGEVGPVGQSGEPGTKGDQGTQGETGTAPTITTEQIEKGATDNPCEGPAVKVTVTPADSIEPPLTEYVCQAYDPVPDIFYTRTQEIFDIHESNTQANCQCNYQKNNYKNVDDCIEERTMSYAQRQLASQCNDIAYYEYQKPAPPKMFEVYDCFFELAKDANACSLAVPQDTCSAQDAETLATCQRSFSNRLTECSDLITEEEGNAVNKWLGTYNEYLTLKSCPFTYSFMFN